MNKKIKILITIIVCIILAIFFYPKDCGRMPDNLMLKVEKSNISKFCNCLGIRISYPFQMLGTPPCYCLGIPTSWQCYYEEVKSEYEPSETIYVPCDFQHKEKKNISISDWKTYSNPEVNFTFKYPNNWEIIDDYFYETASGAESETRTITLQKIKDENSNNWIRINPRQFQREFGKCEGIFCTYSEDQRILDIFSKMSATFELIEN